MCSIMCRRGAPARCDPSAHRSRVDSGFTSRVRWKQRRNETDTARHAAATHQQILCASQLQRYVSFSQGGNSHTSLALHCAPKTSTSLFFK